MIPLTNKIIIGGEFMTIPPKVSCVGVDLVLEFKNKGSDSTQTIQGITRFTFELDKDITFEDFFTLQCFIAGCVLHRNKILITGDKKAVTKIVLGYLIYSKDYDGDEVCKFWKELTGNAVTSAGREWLIDWERWLHNKPPADDFDLDDDLPVVDTKEKSFNVVDDFDL